MSELTIAQHLFQVRYYCSIPNMFFHTKVEMDTVGLMSSGSPEQDRMMLLEDRDIYATIVLMTHFHAMGAPIRLRNPRDSVMIYKMLMAHLRRWQYIAVHMVLSRPNVPFDDLRKMEDFAGKVYALAARYATELGPQDGLLASMANLPSSGLGHLLPGDRYEEKAKLVEHEPVMEGILRTTLLRNAGK